jgi:hypothetical protein
MENQNRGVIDSLKNAPYEYGLAEDYESTETWYAPCHPSAPEYLSLISATTNQCGTDLYPGQSGGPTDGGGALDSYMNVTLGDLLQNNTNYTGRADFTWANYAEDLPSNACTAPSNYSKGGPDNLATGAGLFASKHVPFLYESDTVYSTTFCKDHILSLDPGKYANYTNAQHPAFTSAVAEGKLPNFSFISPNLCDDGHDTCGSGSGTKTGENATCTLTGTSPNKICKVGGTVAQLITDQADPWLSKFLGNLIACSGSTYNASHTTQLACLKEMNSTVIFLLYDEGSGTTPGNGMKAKGESANNNVIWCKGKPYTHFSTYTKSVCGGNIYEVTIIPNSALSVGAGLKFYGTPTSDYSIVATVEWLFDLDNFDQATSEAGMTHFSNPGYLDSLWTDNLVLGGTHTTGGSEFHFSSNGY